MSSVASTSIALAKPASRPWNDWVLWIHAHETKVATAVITLAVTYAILAFAMKTSFTWQTAFFAGYSVDSLADVAIDRFGRLASTQAKLIRDAVSGPADKNASG